MKKIFLIIAGILATIPGFCQEIELEKDTLLRGAKPKFAWKVNFMTHFDNRECDAKYARNDTYFFTRLAPEVGLSLQDGKHSIMGGVVWVQPIGCEWDGNKVSPVLYYKYKTKNLNFGLGFVPRSNLKDGLPNFLESDSVRYFQYTFRGGLVNYETEKGYFKGVIDWRGMRGADRREAFCIIAGGEWNILKRNLYFGGIGMVNHLALTYPVGENQFVIDNMLANLYMGTDLAQYTPFKRLSLNVGFLGSINRDRGDKKWLNSGGLWLDFHAEWWRLRLKNTTFLGSAPLFPLYSRYGCLLYDGEPYYASKYYDRLTVGGVLLKWRNIVELTADLDFNFAQRNMTFAQKLSLHVNI